ncbi:YciI family protein [Cellulomonas fimi]|uniref:YciI family protein n=1 Tax=Cellulomonas fimi TaxID=1708 RepID=UPI00234C24CF|nr:YciI family protein [Cellulomonas fimi]MDC7122081.1 YciI family protein [Cellulomonas fimi]
MPTFAVTYTYDERTDVRDRVRPEHRDYLRSLVDVGQLLGSGPFTEGDPGALLVFRTDDRAALDALLAADPFAREGLVAATAVRTWDVVIGPWSAS